MVNWGPARHTTPSSTHPAPALRVHILGHLLLQLAAHAVWTRRSLSHLRKWCSQARLQEVQKGRAWPISSQRMRCEAQSV